MEFRRSILIGLIKTASWHGIRGDPVADREYTSGLCTETKLFSSVACCCCVGLLLPVDCIQPWQPQHAVLARCWIEAIRTASSTSLILSSSHSAYQSPTVSSRRSSASTARFRSRAMVPILSLNKVSMSSSVRPLVSGTNRNVQIPDTTQKTAKKTYAPNPVFCTSGGVIKPY